MRHENLVSKKMISLKVADAMTLAQRLRWVPSPNAAPEWQARSLAFPNRE